MGVSDGKQVNIPAPPKGLGTHLRMDNGDWKCQRGGYGQTYFPAAGAKKSQPD